jgi:hypothetical protein
MHVHILKIVVCSQPIVLYVTDCSWARTYYVQSTNLILEYTASRKSVALVPAIRRAAPSERTISEPTVQKVFEPAPAAPT